VDVADVWRVIDEERTSLAGLLEELTAEEWERPSLCEGWRVRDVAAHLTLAQLDAGAAAVALVRAGGSFNRMIRDTAIRQASLPVEEYPRRVRAMVGSRRKAPGVTALEPMLDVIVHGQDITVPLGRSRPVPPAPAAVAASRAWTLNWPFRTRRRLGGMRLVATDADWSVGSGSTVEGPIAALLLLVTGRTARLTELTGPGADQLRASGADLFGPGRQPRNRRASSRAVLASSASRTTRSPAGSSVARG
jgi:uncharacterized protein (TIGR03083 family)